MIRKSSALIINNNKMLVVKKKKNPTHYILPGGKIENSETPLDALKRELNEEINLNTVDNDFDFLGIFYTNSQFENSQLETYLFHLNNKKINGEIIIGREIGSYEWISLDDGQSSDLSSGITEFAIKEALKIGNKNDE